MSQKVIENKVDSEVLPESKEKMDLKLDDPQNSKPNKSFDTNIERNETNNSPNHCIDGNKENDSDQGTKENLIKKQLENEPSCQEQMDSLEPLAAAANDTNSK